MLQWSAGSYNLIQRVSKEWYSKEPNMKHSSSLPSSILTPTGAVVATSSSFSRARRPIYLANVFCTGRESGIESCSSFSYSLTTGIDLMSELEVAAVACQRLGLVEMRQLQSNITTAVFVAFIFTLLAVVLAW